MTDEKKIIRVDPRGMTREELVELGRRVFDRLDGERAENLNAGDETEGADQPREQ